MKKCTFIILVAIFSLSLSAQTTYYVNGSGGNDSNNGTTWNSALSSIQTALDKAVSGDKVWVAKGTYKPSKIAGDTPSTDNRDKSFSIPEGVSVFGGFAGNESANYNLSLRNFETNETILSGSLDGIMEHNAYHVIIISAVIADISLDGFSIKDGYADGTGYFNVHGKPIYRAQAGGVTITSGGAKVFLKNNSIHDNISFDWGGGIYVVSNGSPSYLINNKIWSNLTTSRGAGIYAYAYSTQIYIINNLIYNNSSSDNGGGMYINTKNNVYVINNTICNNTATNGGAVYGYTPVTSGNILLSNSILWGNTPTLIAGHSTNVGITTVQNSIVQGGHVGGTNIIVADPTFVDGTNGNFRLSNSSPAKNAGNNSSYDLALYGNVDLDNNARIFNTTIDIGAYEFGSQKVVSAVSIPASNNIVLTCSSDNLKIKGLIGNETISVFDMSGRNISTNKATRNEFSMSINSLNKGVYFIHIASLININNIKFIKK